MMCVECTVLVGLTRLQALCLCGHIWQELQDVLTKGAFDRAAAKFLFFLEFFIIAIILSYQLNSTSQVLDSVTHSVHSKTSSQAENRKQVSEKGKLVTKKIVSPKMK